MDGYKFKNLFIFTLLFIFIILYGIHFCDCTAKADEQKRVYIIGGDVNFPPYEFMMEINGQKVYRGFNVDIMKAIALQTGIEIEFRPMIWADAIKALDEGKIDAIQGMKYSEERAKKYEFSDSYITNVSAVFVLKDSPVVRMTDLVGKKVAVQEGDAAFQKLQNSNLYELIMVEDQEKAFEMLFSKKVDAVVGNKLVGQYILQQKRKIDMVKLAGQEIDPQAYAIAVRKGNIELLSIFNKGLYEIKKNGIYDKIYEKWFGKPLDYPLQYYKKQAILMLYGFGLMFVIASAMFYLNYLLQKEVKRRMDIEKKLMEKIAFKDKMEALGNLVAGIAHEIRTPLTSIKTFVELLPEKYENPLFREKISYFLPREIERINSLLNSLLDYAKPQKPVRKNENLYEIIENMLILFDPIFKRKKINVVATVDPNLKVYVDRNQILQVFMNVVMNAIEALGSIKDGKLQISAIDNHEKVIVVFEDNGIGIDEDNIKKVFDPFFTTKEAGTGLGLSVSYKLLKENGGNIWIESELGRGTKVFIGLPANEEGDR
ncbi:transporter substrate-binding domain-containing protein [Thermovenabulum sp.]|uniref:transporter substrate-binding domain-containing protein n=1 Tax=Thermovenabulum sp. TaxID=3100335 RepID=UPI003C7D9318